MGNIGWINTENYSFDCMLRMERFQIRLMLENLYDEAQPAMAAALKTNPKVAWLFEHKCPEMAGRVKALTEQAPDGRVVMRIVTSWATAPEDVDRFILPDALNDLHDAGSHGGKM